MNDELKPCPFCGGKPFEYELEGTNTSRMHNHADYIVQCDECIASTDRFSRPHKAIKAWNKRTRPSIVEE